MRNPILPQQGRTRRCLTLEAWPEADRQAWQHAIQAGDVLDPGRGRGRLGSQHP
jgi:hypothetical protein